MRPVFLTRFAIPVLMCVTASALSAPPPATRPATAPATQPAARGRFGMVVDDLSHRPNGEAMVKQFGGNLVVSGVTKGSRAERTGVRVGDVITHIDGKEVHTYQDLIDASRAPGLKVLDILRDKQPMTLK